MMLTNLGELLDPANIRPLATFYFMDCFEMQSPHKSVPTFFNWGEGFSFCVFLLFILS